MAKKKTSKSILIFHFKKKAYYRLYNSSYTAMFQVLFGSLKEFEVTIIIYC